MASHPNDPNDSKQTRLQKTKPETGSDNSGSAASGFLAQQHLTNKQFSSSFQQHLRQCSVNSNSNISKLPPKNSIVSFWRQFQQAEDKDNKILKKY